MHVAADEGRGREAWYSHGNRRLSARTAAWNVVVDKALGVGGEPKAATVDDAADTAK